ncbi:hypothetical protein DM02DRAFT_201978 [Periconia macrospinosa]|uniref:Uncharacterized protein n=1 Tax=Periconia macrospinosa TaxID=97972 RepID=A0A2V1E1W3_9PLEO|nr:hypothetical protein DM02DRAFT_201978 [Periconia macrospinosa]
MHNLHNLLFPFYCSFFSFRYLRTSLLAACPSYRSSHQQMAKLHMVCRGSDSFQTATILSFCYTLALLHPHVYPFVLLCVCARTALLRACVITHLVVNRPRERVRFLCTELGALMFWLDGIVYVGEEGRGRERGYVQASSRVAILLLTFKKYPLSMLNCFTFNFLFSFL